MKSMNKYTYFALLVGALWLMKRYYEHNNPDSYFLTGAEWRKP
jgi:hypothetical protein